MGGVFAPGGSQSRLLCRVHFLLSLKIHVTRIVLALVEKMKPGSSRRLMEAKSSEERSKDPAIVSINTVVVNHRITFAFGRHADERSTGAFITTRRQTV